MSAPVSGADTRPLFTGDNTDDDAAVVDSLLIETDAPPTPVIEHIDPAPLVKPTPLTVLRTGTYVMDNTVITQPIKILIGDRYRKSIQLSGWSAAATPGINDYAMFAYDPGLLTPGSAFRLRHNQTLPLTGHTGDLYILPGPAVSATFEVTYAVVTE